MIEDINTVEAQVATTQVATRDTGPLQKIGNFITSFTTGNNRDKQGKRATPIVDNRPAIERMRDTIEAFDEDYKNIGDRLLGVFMQTVGYLGPFVLVIGVGYDLGLFYAPVWGFMTSMIVAYVIESVIAGATLAMGRAFEEFSTGKAKIGKVALTVLVWLVLNLSTAIGLYWQASHGGLLQGAGASTMLILRVSAIALADLGCSVLLMWKGRSLQKHIESIKKKASAISELAEAQRAIQEADKNAAMREQQMTALLKAQEDLTEKISYAMSMMMNEVINNLEQGMKSKNEGRHSRY